MIKLRIFAVFSFLAVLTGTWITLDPYPVLAATIVPEEECYEFLPEGNALLLAGMPFKTQDGELLSAALSAMDTWKSYTGEVFGAGEADPDVVFGYGDGVNTITYGQIDDNYGAFTYYQVGSFTDGSLRVIEWDIVLNKTLSWGDAFANSDLFDLQGMLTHELGHALGLSHPTGSECLLNTMNDTYSIGFRNLGEGDIEGVKVLYH